MHNIMPAETETKAESPAQEQMEVDKSESDVTPTKKAAECEKQDVEEKPAEDVPDKNEKGDAEEVSDSPVIPKDSEENVGSNEAKSGEASPETMDTDEKVVSELSKDVEEKSGQENETVDNDPKSEEVCKDSSEKNDAVLPSEDTAKDVPVAAEMSEDTKEKDSNSIQEQSDVTSPSEADAEKKKDLDGDEKIPVASDAPENSKEKQSDSNQEKSDVTTSETVMDENVPVDSETPKDIEEKTAEGSQEKSEAVSPQDADMDEATSVKHENVEKHLESSKEDEAVKKDSVSEDTQGSNDNIEEKSDAASSKDVDMSEKDTEVEQQEKENKTESSEGNETVEKGSQDGDRAKESNDGNLEEKVEVQQQDHQKEECTEEKDPKLEDEPKPSTLEETKQVAKEETEQVAKEEKPEEEKKVEEHNLVDDHKSGDHPMPEESANDNDVAAKEPEQTTDNQKNESTEEKPVDASEQNKTIQPESEDTAAQVDEQPTHSTAQKEENDTEGKAEEPTKKETLKATPVEEDASGEAHDMEVDSVVANGHAKEVTTLTNGHNAVSLNGKGPSKRAAEDSEESLPRKILRQTGPTLNYKKTTDNAFCPTKMSDNAAGFDLYSAYSLEIPPGKTGTVKIDVRLQPSEGYYGRVIELGKEKGIEVKTRVIDREHTDAVEVQLMNHGDSSYCVEKGDRVAQLVLEKIIHADLREVSSFD